MYPIDNEHGDIPGSYVSLPEGQQNLELEPFTEPKELQLKFPPGMVPDTL